MLKNIATCLLLGFVLSVGWPCVSPSMAYSPKQIYKKAGPGVVFIFASKGSSKGSGGTGSIIRKDGLVITNAHLFKQKDSSKLLTNISVFLKPERVTGNHKTDLAKGYKGTIIAYDIPLDLALVKIVDPNMPLPTVNFADSEIVDIGEQVYAIGHPEQGGLWSLTTGVISAYWSDYGGVPGKNLFQTDASINRGNSGGPLLDDAGDMIGINAMIARKAADGLTITDVNFSIRTSVAIAWLRDNGYRFTAVQRKSDEPAEMVATTPAVPLKKAENVTTPPEEPKEETTEPLPKTQATGKKQPDAAVESQTGKKDHPTDILEEETKGLSSGQSEPPDDLIAQKPESGKILTDKKPYRMDDLLEGMREMEDLMDEMKDMMDDFKKRRTE